MQCTVYSLAGDFQGRNFHGSVGSAEKMNAKPITRVGMVHLNFMERTFMSGPQTTKFVKVQVLVLGMS